MHSHDPSVPIPARRPYLWPWALSAGVLAGLTSWLGGEVTYGRFTPAIRRPANFDRMSPYEKTDVLSQLTREATPDSEAKNTATANGLLGALLGAALGLAGGLSQRRWSAALVATLVGALAGAAAGAGMSAALTRVFYANNDPESGMLLALLIHGGIWLPIGAAAGLALGVGLGGTRAIVLAVLGGLAGAVLGTMLYEVLNAILYPLDRVLEPVPAGRVPRLLACLSIAACTALGAALGVRKRHHDTALPTRIA